MGNPEKENVGVVAEIGSTAVVAHELKKAPEAIYVKPKGGKITLTMHKAYNILLARAAAAGVENDTYEVSLSDLIGDIKFGSHNTEALKEMLRRLQATQVEWDIVGGNNRVGEWGISSMLAGAIISRGKLEYSFAPQIKKKLLDPRIFARIDLRLMGKFRTRSGLALYEACYRYINNPGGLTVKLKWQEWRDILSEGAGASEWRYFNRDTLKPAIAEVNAHVPDMEVAPILFHAANGRVDELQFRINRKRQPDLVLEGNVDVDISPNSDLLKRVAALGLSEKEARKLFLDHEEDQILQALNVTEARIAKKTLKPIENKPAFFKKAISEGYALPPEKVKQIAKQVEKKALELESKSAANQAAASWAIYEAMPEDDRNQLIATFAQEVVFLDPVLQVEFLKKGISSAIVRGHLRGWLKTKLPVPA
jgi:hypothetical protein